MRIFKFLLFVFTSPVFAGESLYLDAKQPLPSSECKSLVLRLCNKGDDGGSTCREIDGRLEKMHLSKRTSLAQMSEPGCKKVRRYTTSYLMCSDFLPEDAQKILRKASSDEISAHPDEVSDVRKCVHAIQDLNFSEEMALNIKQLFSATETVGAPKTTSIFQSIQETASAAQ